jgi:hypothetical protein
MATLDEIRDAKRLKQMGKAHDRAPYYSMGTTPPKEAKPVTPPPPKPAPVIAPPPARPKTDADMTPEQEAILRRRMAQEKMDKGMDEAYERAPYESMGTKEYKKGGAVSASRRADGIAQRGKTKGRMV